MTDTTAFNNDVTEKYHMKKLQVKEWGKASIYGDNYTPCLYSYVRTIFPLFGVCVMPHGKRRLIALRSLSTENCKRQDKINKIELN